jgi:hypothetical protein
MSLEDRLQVGFAVVLILSILAGLFVRRRARFCWSFVAYLLAVALSDLLVALWPDRFWRRDVWMFKENVHNVLKLAMVAELTVRIFRPFPSAYAAARRAVVLLVIGLAAVVVFTLSRGTDYRSIVGRVYPHLYDGTVWLFIVLGGYCLWYHLPLNAIHKAILVALVPYLLVYSVVMRGLVRIGWEQGEMLNATAPIAYLGVLFHWVWVAWKKNPEADPDQRIARLVKARNRGPAALA